MDSYTKKYKKEIVMKRILTIVTLILIVALALTACGKSNKKETVYDILADAIGKTASNGQSESASVWEQALNGGSIAAEFTYGEDIIPIKTISGKSYYGKDSAASVLSLSLISGEKLDFSAFSDAEKAVFLSSVFTGAYGFTNQGLAEFLTKMFAPQEGTAASASTALSAGLVKFLEKNEDKFTDIFEKHFPLTMNKAESSLNFSVMISNTNTKAFLADYITLLEKDADFKQTLQDYLVASGAPVTSGEMNEAFEEMRDELNELDDIPFNATVSITATTDRIITGASLTVYEGSDTTGKQLARVLLSLPASGGFNIEATIEGQSFNVGCTVTEFGTVTKETLSISAMGVTLTPLTLTYDSANGDYEVKVELPGTFTAVAKGNYKATKSEATLKLSSIKVTIPTDYSDMEDVFGGASDTVIDLPMTMTITAKAKDKAPKAPTSYKDITTLSENELEALAEEFMSDPVFQTFVEMVEELFGSAETVRPID